jgi:hypothetical protein
MNTATKGFMAVIITSLSTAALAGETQSYTYDAKGRLVRTVKSGTVNNGVTAEYAHDRTDNRTRVRITGAP